MKILFILLSIVLTLLAITCCAPKKGPPLETVPFVDLEKYSGRWYEIARYPHRFEEGCSNVTAEYVLQQDGTMKVINRCTLEKEEGKTKKATGIAKVADQASNARLRVSFFRPFYGDYWILKLAPDYQYAIVGAPSREYLWILSRTPEISEELYSQLLDDIRSYGYDPDQLIRTSHTPQ